MEQMIRIQIDRCHIVEEEKILELELSGSWPHPVPGGRLRLSAVFRGRQTDRHYPLKAGCRQDAEGNTILRASARIQLQDIFYKYRREGEETVSLRFACCDKEKWHLLDEEVSLPARLFEKEEIPAGRWERAWKRFCYVLCTLLLPLWLLDGYQACRGKKPLHPAAKGMRGKKAVLYHAHGLVSGWTGYGYSIREMKTNYLKRKYEKACKKISRPEGVLFLSERRVERGGNLDLVRGQLRKEGFCRITEFLNTKPVHKLKWSELRQSALLLAGAQVIVLEDFYPQLHALSIRPETGILQMWHACGAFKLFGLSELGLVDHLEQSTANHRNYTAALASGRDMVPFYSEAYGVREACIRPIGVPRTDVFFRQDRRDCIREELFRKYPACRGKKIILYAPTFRGSGNKTAYFPTDKFPVGQVMASLPDDVVLLLKNHPFVKDKWEVPQEYRERVLDLSEEEHINDLLFITSLLVTDYSSVIFEASLLSVPVIFYAFDLQEYLAGRDLYFDFASFAPGDIVSTVEELVERMGSALQNGSIHPEEYEKFRQFFLGSLDGHSTERTVQLIRDMISDVGVCGGTPVQGRSGDYGRTEDQAAGDG